MKASFYALADALAASLQGEEVLLCNLFGERSDFVRFNGGRVRQAGSVEQRQLSLRLVDGRRQASAELALSGTPEDEVPAHALLARLRDTLPALPDDPWLEFNALPCSTECERRGRLPEPSSAVGDIVGAAGVLDLVGIYAAGPMMRGFANSLGQRNWHEVENYNFDWSVHRDGRAVKSGSAGSEWNAGEVAAQIETAAGQLALLARPAKAIAPGEHRAYLAPRALDELTGLLGWGGFSARARETRQTPLLRMLHGESLAPCVTLLENTRDGMAAGFQADGFVKPAHVTLVDAGRLGDALVSPRSAREYGLAGNAANGHETPLALDVAPGTLHEDDVLAALDTGVWISNLWYLNFSDRAAGRITGMTRFATFWVEGGELVAPLEPMRFDDSIYRMLGSALIGLTESRALIADPSSYGERSHISRRLPGALLSGLRFTL